MQKLVEQVWMHDHTQAQRKPASEESVQSETKVLIIQKKNYVFLHDTNQYLQDYNQEAPSVHYTVQLEPQQVQVQVELHTQNM